MSTPAMVGQSSERPLRRRRAEARPAEIIAAAWQLFEEKGYAATKLEEVALRAGVSKGTIYLYFDGKKALFQAVVREGLSNPLPDWTDRLANDAGSSSDLLRDIVMDVWQVLRTDRAGRLLKLVISEAGNFPNIDRDYLECVSLPSVAPVRDVISRGMARGEFRTVDPDALAQRIMASVLFRILWEHSFGHGTPAAPAHHSLTEFLSVVVAGLRCRGGEP